MKKYLLFILLLLICLSFVFVKPQRQVYNKLIDIQKEKQYIASRILYNYILKSNNMTSKQIKDFANIEQKCVYAISTDLNDDNKNEIVGFTNCSTFYYSQAGYSLFILQKGASNQYQNISLLSFQPWNGISILKNKTNKYHDIKHTPSAKVLTGKYKNKFYQY